MYIRIRTRPLLVILFLIGSGPLHAQGYLKVKGKQILQENGKPFIFRGMGLGGWMLQEGYMFQLSFLGQEYRIREKIAASVGEQNAAEFYDQWLSRHTTIKDIEFLAAAGFNSIRLPMHYALYTLPVEKEPVKGEHTWLEKGFQLTDSLLQWCKENQLYLILDLHAAPGGQGNDLAISDRDPSKPSLWESAANQAKTIALWKKLAARYAKESWIAGYDILNETNWGFEDSTDTRGTKEKTNIPLRKLLMEITQAIREVDPHHIIFLEGNGFANNYKGILPPWDDKLVLSFHKYGNFNTKKSIQTFLDLRNQYELPIWLGETGENFNTWFTEAIGLMEAEGIGWTWWPHKKIGINNPLSIQAPNGYDRLLASWSGKGAIIDSTEAWNILQELLANISFDSNEKRRDVLDAMFRQVQPHKSIPFKTHTLTDSLALLAADYDLGAQQVAYADRDTASYHYTPGVQTTGNRGRTYRNDGVDIKAGKDGPVIFCTEEGEWLHYTIDVNQSGKYEMKIRARADSVGAGLKLSCSNQSYQLEIPISASAQMSFYSFGNYKLKKGRNQLTLRILKGGSEFDRILIRRIQK